jgi:glutamate-5-semialdehyde dehydrogenase
MARQASAQLAALPAGRRTTLLEAMATKLTQYTNDILVANKKDCRAAAAAVERGEMTEALYKRLKLDEHKLNAVIDGIRQVAAMPDVLGKVELARELDDDLQLYRTRCPIGVVLVIFEARPDALPQIASLLIKSGNAGLLKGGREAQHSNEAIMACIHLALEAGDFPRGAYALVSNRHAAGELLKMDKYIDLVIPRGSGELVRQIQDSTRIPVLGHAEGICHLYVHHDADMSMALELALDSKTNYPAACNSIETLLVHKDVAFTFLPQLSAAARETGIEIRMAPREAEFYGITGAVVPATEKDWSTEYCDLIVSLKVVDSLESAIAHINKYGSQHTDAIVTESREAFDKFFAEVNSAGVFWNASTRFADGFRYGFGAEVGISTGKLHPRGPVGVDGITTYKYKLMGKGHVVADYTGDGARQFTHKDLPLDKK